MDHACGLAATAQFLGLAKVMRIFTFVAVGLLMSSPTQGACVKPIAPSCAIKGAFASAAEWDQCRYQMIAYKGGMEVFALCLQEEGQDGRLAEQELENVLSEFNLRSRALPDDGL